MSIVNKYKRHTYSYWALRKAVGWIGVLLPFVLVIGAILVFHENRNIQESISHYYHTDMRDVFVGALCAVALFMFFYTGYDERDNWAGHAAGLFAIGIAWFPTTEVGSSDFIGKIHFVCAASFFLVLSYFSLFLFTKTKKGRDPTPQKKTRNKIYLTCGLIMIACLIAIALYKIFVKDPHPESFFVFAAETIALVAFGVSWLTKGETLYPDKPVKRKADM